MFSPAFAVLPSAVQATLLSGVKKKFDSYFMFTAGPACTRATEIRRTADGEPIYIYSDQSMISDLTVLWSLFCELYEVLTRNGMVTEACLQAIVAKDQRLLDEFRRIFDEEGEFWTSSTTRRSLQQVSAADALGKRLLELWKTLRNGYAHFHWRYEDLSAIDYWQAMGWDTQSAPPAFDLSRRSANNYKAYIADAKPPWNPAKFWDQRDLRICVAQYTTFRYSLHKFLNILLNNNESHVFAY